MNVLTEDETEALLFDTAAKLSPAGMPTKVMVVYEYEGEDGKTLKVVTTESCAIWDKLGMAQSVLLLAQEDFATQ